MATTTGVVRQVDVNRLGSQLLADAPSGTTVLTLDTAAPFSPTGGSLTLDDVTVAYVSADAEAGTITLADPLGATLEAGLPVWQMTGNEIDVTYWAAVDLDDPDAGPISARVPASIRGWLSPGRDYGVDPVAVTLRLDAGTWEVIDPNQVTTFDGSFLDSETLPPAPLPPLDPPETPSLSLRGFPRGFMLQIGNAAPGTEFEVFVLPGTADAAEQAYPSVAGAPIYRETLPDGTAFVADVDYAFRVRAFNGTLPDALSTSVTGRLVLNDSSTVIELAVGKLLSGDLTAAVALLGSLSVGAAITIDSANGIKIAQPGGGVIHFPADGSAARITSHADLYSVVVRGNMIVRGLTNELSTGASLTMSAGVSAPQAEPAVSRTWNVLSTGLTGAFQKTHFGLTDGAAGYLLTAMNFGGGSLREIHATTGAVNPFVFGKFNWGQDFVPTGGVVKLGTNYFVLGMDFARNNAWYVYKLDSAYQKVSEWAWVSSTVKRPAIGTDGTSVLIAWSSSDGTFFRVIARNPSTWAAVSSVDCTHNLGVTYDVGGVYRGSADLGADRFVIAPEARDPMVFSSTGVRQASQEFTRAGATGVRGLHWNGTRFRHLSDAAVLWDYETLPSKATRSIAYSWFDSDEAGTGQHETDPGPAKVYTQVARSRFTVQTGTPNDTGDADAPDSVRIWIDGQRQPDLAVGATEATYGVPASGTTTKAPSYATAGLTPAKIAASSNGFSIDGASNGSVGTGSFRDSVRAAVEEDYDAGAWTAYIPQWTASTANPLIGDGSIEGAYQQFGKTVHFRISIKAGSTTTFGSGQWRLTLPVPPVTFRWTYLGDANLGGPSFPVRGIWTTELAMVTPGTTAGGADRSVSATSPGTWASGHTLFISGTYEAA